LSNGEATVKNATMGKVLVTARIENLYDLFNVSQGILKPEEVRSIEVTDALVDTGASTLCLPKRFVAQLGLKPGQSRRARTTAGTTRLQSYGAMRLTIQGRDWVGDVLEVPDDCPVLVGQLALEALDFVVDPMAQCLIGNPAHGGEQMVELF
jgi:clan AA aspartic protease